MKEVAEKAGVTQATVSMSLANHSRISEATRKRIQLLAKEMGYRPNPYIAALMRGRRRRKSVLSRPVLALVNALEGVHAWKDSPAVTVRQMRIGALARAEERGYEAREFWLHQDGMSAERFSGVLHNRGIEGVLLSPQRPDEPPPSLRWERFAAVRLGVPLPGFTLASVGNDHFFSSLQCVRECYRLGYRRPGLVLLRQHRVRFSARWDGGVLAACHLLPALRPARTLEVESWEDLAEVENWIRSERVDVVLSPSGDLIHAHLQSLGWRCPDDIGIASLACSERDHWCSGIWQNGLLLGATAVDVLISMLERNERGLPAQTPVTMVEGYWNPGQTLHAVEPTLNEVVRRRGRGKAKNGEPSTPESDGRGD